MSRAYQKRIKVTSIAAAIVSAVALLTYLAFFSPGQLSMEGLSASELRCPQTIQSVDRNGAGDLKVNARSLELPAVAQAYECVYSGSTEPVVGVLAAAPKLTYSYPKSRLRTLESVTEVKSEKLESFQGLLQSKSGKCGKFSKNETLYLVKFAAGKWVGVQVASGNCRVVALTEDPVTVAAGASERVPSGAWYAQ